MSFVWLDPQLTTQSLLHTGAFCITIQSVHVSKREKQRMVLSKSVLSITLVNIFHEWHTHKPSPVLADYSSNICNAECNYIDIVLTCSCMMMDSSLARSL